MRFVCVLDDEEDGVWSFFGREENVVYIGATSGGLKVAWAGNGGAGGFEVDVGVGAGGETWAGVG